MRIVYISDFFYPEASGGAEQNDAVLLELLEASGHKVIKKKSDSLDLEFLEANRDSKFIVSNFVFLFNRFRNYLQENCDYVLYTHDHQYLMTRDPTPYFNNNYVAPQDDLRHVEFYRHAKGVICQSALHAEIVYRNLKLDQIYNVAGNLWENDTLDLLEVLSVLEKAPKTSIMVSNISHKNTEGAIKYCQKTNTNYELLYPKPHQEFLADMAKNETLVFFPQTVETLSRIVVEARMMNCKVKTSNTIGAASEDWFQLKGKELIAVMRNKREEIPALIEKIFSDE